MIDTRSRAKVTALAIAVCLAAIVPASAQPGQGQGPPVTPPGQGRPDRPGPPASRAGRGGAPTTSAEFTVRNFGTWVDDAYVLAPGEAWVGFGAGLWRLSSVDQIDAPVFDASIGVAPRVHLSATVPVSTLQYPEGISDRTLGDVYLSAKVGLRDPQTGVGVALTPVLEVLADGTWPDEDGDPIGRVHWGVPVNLEWRATGFRVYGSAGYFSRGAVFGSGTVDVAVGERAGVIGLISYTHSTDTLADSSLRHSRTDASGGAYLILRPSVSVYGLAGRTVSALDDYGSRFFVSGGVSLRVAEARTPRSD